MSNHKIISDIINIINEYIYTGKWSELDEYVNQIDPYDQLKALTALRASYPVKQKLPSYSSKYKETQIIFEKDNKGHMLVGLNV